MQSSDAVLHALSALVVPLLVALGNGNEDVVGERVVRVAFLDLVRVHDTARLLVPGIKCGCKCECECKSHDCNQEFWGRVVCVFAHVKVSVCVCVCVCVCLHT
jgi:hypothetical protein